MTEETRDSAAPSYLTDQLPRFRNVLQRLFTSPRWRVSGMQCETRSRADSTGLGSVRTHRSVSAGIDASGSTAVGVGSGVCDLDGFSVDTGSRGVGELVKSVAAPRLPHGYGPAAQSTESTRRALSPHGHHGAPRGTRLAPTVRSAWRRPAALPSPTTSRRGPLRLV